MKARTKKLSALSKDELKSICISLISGHDKEEEIAHLLAVFTAIKLPLSSAVKYKVSEHDTPELIDLIESGVLNTKGGYDEEDKAWNLIFDSLKPDMVMSIINDIAYYMKRYARSVMPVNDLKLSLLKGFVEMEVDTDE